MLTAFVPFLAIQIDADNTESPLAWWFVDDRKMIDGPHTSYFAAKDAAAAAKEELPRS